MRIELYAMVIDAARAGLGVGLVPRFYVQQDVAVGTLAIPVDVSLKHEKRYCFVYPAHQRESPMVQAFGRWAQEMAKDFGAAPEPNVKQSKKR